MSNEVVPVELYGLRGFSPMNIWNTRLFFEAWNACHVIQQLPTVERHHLRYMCDREDTQV